MRLVVQGLGALGGRGGTKGLRSSASEHGPFSTTAPQFEAFVKRHYDVDRSPALGKLLQVNASTMIQARSGLLDADAPLLNGDHPASIEDITALFLSQGVGMATRACTKAIDEWGGSANAITHMVSVSCTNTANPGFDHLVAQNLGLRSDVEKTLLAGIGCSGGLAALRLAANLVMAAAYQGKRAVALVCACEVTSALARAELDRIAQTGTLHIGVVLFSDGAGALILTNEEDAAQDGGEAVENGRAASKGIFELKKWVNLSLPDTTEHLGFDASANGWKVILSPQVPELTAKAMPQLFRSLATGQSTLLKPDACDWAVQSGRSPGGALILKAAEQVFQLTPKHLWASWHVYAQHGNSSSPTVLQVLDALRRKPGRKQVVAMAFGPGINAEGALLERL